MARVKAAKRRRRRAALTRAIAPAQSMVGASGVVKLVASPSGRGLSHVHHAGITGLMTAASGTSSSARTARPRNAGLFVSVSVSIHPVDD